MRPVFPAALLLVLFPACGAASTRGPNPTDKPGGATNMQPGSGGTYNDVVRSEGAEPSPPPAAQPPAETNTEPKKEPAPHGKP